MNKRSFLKTSGALLTGGMLSDLLADEKRTNWAGNYQYSTENLHVPKNVAELQKVVRNCAKLRALGAKHSFNGIADSTQNQVSLKHFDSMEVDAKAHCVTVGAAVTYGKVAPYLDSRGFALHNLASLPHISVVGACATATHGSGVKNGNLSTAVRGIELVNADGELVTLTKERDGDHFSGAGVALGSLGVITKITLETLPTFQMRQYVYENLAMEQLEHHLDEIFSSAYSVSLFTDWQKHRITQVWVKKRVEKNDAGDAKADFFGARLATRKLHPLAGHSAENCTEQLGIPGPWYERLPHFRMNFTPSSGAELQTEYFVRRDQGYKAILAVEELRDHITPHLFITELRAIAADDLWMSPCHQRDAMTIHFTWKPEWPDVKKALPMIEEKLAPFAARPHWAKLFTVTPAHIQAQYPKLAEFKALASHYDPKGKFRNEFVNTNLFGG